MKLQIMIQLFCISFIAVSYAQTWSFAVLSDPRFNSATFKNALLEIRDMKVKPSQKLHPAECVIVAGDFACVRAKYNYYTTIFKDDTYMKAFLPVKGNHEGDRHTKNIVKMIMPEQDSITVRDNKYVNYYTDWKNARFIIVDQYSDLGSDGCINSKGREWVEELIRSAHNADHVFIFFHEPAFPRFRHLHDSFNACRDDRDAFWNMLVKYRTKVKAVFNGHIHQYYRMRVMDPKSSEANDTTSFPDEEGGIYHVNCGATGQGSRSTIVRVQIKDKNVSFIVLDADEGRKKSFQVIDEWEIVNTGVSLEE
jgi:hypothetical protein